MFFAAQVVFSFFLFVMVSVGEKRPRSPGHSPPCKRICYDYDIDTSDECGSSGSGDASSDSSSYSEYLGSLSLMPPLDPLDFNALILPVVNQDLTAVRQCLRRGRTLPFLDDVELQVALVCACHFGQLDMVMTITDHCDRSSASIMCIDDDDEDEDEDVALTDMEKTALVVASIRGHTAVVLHLLQHWSPAPARILKMAFRQACHNGRLGLAHQLYTQHGVDALVTVQQVADYALLFECACRRRDLNKRNPAATLLRRLHAPDDLVAALQVNTECHCYKRQLKLANNFVSCSGAPLAPRERPAYSVVTHRSRTLRNICAHTRPAVLKWFVETFHMVYNGDGKSSASSVYLFDCVKSKRGPDPDVYCGPGECAFTNACRHSLGMLLELLTLSRLGQDNRRTPEKYLKHIMDNFVEACLQGRLDIACCLRTRFKLTREHVLGTYKGHILLHAPLPALTTAQCLASFSSTPVCISHACVAAVPFCNFVNKAVFIYFFFLFLPLYTKWKSLWMSCKSCKSCRCCCPCRYWQRALAQVPGMANLHTKCCKSCCRPGLAPLNGCLTSCAPLTAKMCRCWACSKSSPRSCTTA